VSLSPSLSDPALILGLQDEIRRSADARYDHRLHGVLLVLQGYSCREAAALLGDAPRTVQYWVTRFDREGLAGLVDLERPGRPPRLSVAQSAAIAAVLRQPPAAVGFSGAIWDGKTLAAYLEETWALSLGVRQCQRLFHALDFRLRKPRPVLAKADPHHHATAKKNSKR
jgi:transposase